MATRYVEIVAAQSPTDIGEDEAARPMLSFNFDVLAAGPSDKFEQEVVKLISDAGLGTFGSDVFVGRGVNVPAGAGPFVNVINTGGRAADETHNGSTYERLSFQVVVRAGDYQAARTRALAIWRALNGKRNTTVAA